MSSFSVTSPAWWGYAGIGVAIMLLGMCVLKAQSQFSGTFRRVAQLMLVAFFGTMAYLAFTRIGFGIDVQDDTLAVQWQFTRDTATYHVTQVRYFDEMSEETGVGRRSDRQHVTEIGFADGATIRIPEDHTNYRELQSYLTARGVRKRSPFERPPVQH